MNITLEEILNNWINKNSGWKKALIGGLILLVVATILLLIGQPRMTHLEVANRYKGNVEEYFQQGEFTAKEKTFDEEPYSVTINKNKVLVKGGYDRKSTFLLSYRTVTLTAKEVKGKIKWACSHNNFLVPLPCLYYEK